jgi:hypothetical protein
MKAIRGLMCCVGLAFALSPLATFADSTSDHLAAELANANAQLVIAQGMASDITAQGLLSAQNDRTIALNTSTAMREEALGESANGNAIEQITKALATFARSQGDVNARNELIILQGRAATIVSKYTDSLANARAIGRQDEIANSTEQLRLARQVADGLTGVLAETNMSNARLIAENLADALHTPGLAQAANGMAIGANDLFAADLVLSAGTLNATSSTITASTKAAAVLAHASDSLKNAQAMAAASR